MEIVVRPDGDLVDFDSWDEFAELMTQLVKMAPGRVVLDLVNVTRMSSNYIGTVISSFKAAHERGHELMLIGVQPKLYDLLDMLKLNEILPIKRA